MILRLSFWTTAAILWVAFTATGCSRTAPTTAPASDTASTDRTADLEALYWARQENARTDFTEADVRFMTHMIGHHAQALVISQLAPTHDASASVQTLAARIINAQKDEIATMQRWLRQRNQPVPEIHIDGTELMVHSAEGHTMSHGMDMPGMLTQAQIDSLDAARGTDFDRLFLRYMIEHHRGAVTMVDTLFSTDGAAQDEAAFKLASDINVDQQTEIARMERMLQALPETDGDS